MFFLLLLLDLPEHGPQITGKIQEEYENGDNLVLNCSSAKSFPPARLSWFINDQMVIKPILTYFSISRLLCLLQRTLGMRKCFFLQLYTKND